MEKEKYYTPSIEEFHVGFEYEILRHSSHDSTLSGWFKTVFSLREDSNEIDLLFNKRLIYRLRVKYLDSSDIESFGFKYDGKSCYTLSDYTLSGQIQYQNIEIEQNHQDSCMGEWVYFDEVKFNGKIKNKSELSRLLKQLSII